MFEDTPFGLTWYVDRAHAFDDLDAAQAAGTVSGVSVHLTCPWCDVPFERSYSLPLPYDIHVECPACETRQRLMRPRSNNRPPEEDPDPDGLYDRVESVRTRRQVRLAGEVCGDSDRVAELNRYRRRTIPVGILAVCSVVLLWCGVVSMLPPGDFRFLVGLVGFIVPVLTLLYATLLVAVGGRTTHYPDVSAGMVDPPSQQAIQREWRYFEKGVEDAVATDARDTDAHVVERV
jgi:hypothetical protein